MGNFLLGIIPGLAQQAATPVGGYTLANGTGTILSWTPPNDGKQHRTLVFASMSITTLEAGGAIQANFNVPSGATYAYTLFGASQGVGFNYNAFYLPVIVQAGQPVTITQASALTSGAAVMWAEIWGS